MSQYLNVSDLVIVVFFVISCILCFILYIAKYGMAKEHEINNLIWACNSEDKVSFVLSNDHSLTLSVIIPAYNEESRLPTMLDECTEFLKNRRLNDNTFSYEIIIVDDGSADKTSQVATEYSKNMESGCIRVLRLIENRGKGGAVRAGMLCAKGRYLLFADADGATKFSDLEKLEVEMKSAEEDNINSVVIGSRAHLENDSIASRSFFRTILMYGFHFLVWFFGVRSVRDSQCGFKLFTREAATLLFPVLHVERWAFDVELLFLAEKMKMPIREVSVNWIEIEGSKIIPVWSWLQMGSDLMMMWLRYQIGIWKATDINKLVLIK